MTRRLLLTLWLGALCAAADKPNVLFIAIDDLNDWIGCMNGHPQAQTPNLDRLARKGTLFLNAHCNAPICGPSRASLLSGRYPHTTGVYNQPKGKPGLYADKRFFRGKMLPEAFSQAGYATYGVGKVGHGIKLEDLFQVFGTKGGSGPKPGTRRFHYTPQGPYTGTQTDWGAFPDRDELMPDHQTADWAVEHLEKMDGDKPFFLAVGFNRPHVPFYVPQKWFDRYPLDEIQLPAIRKNDFNDIPETSRAMHELPRYPTWNVLEQDGQFSRCVQAYLACITFVDHQVGRVLDALEAGPHAKNTVIVLFSDHGYHLGEKDRVSKHSLWEESTRVPLIIAKPGREAKRSRHPVGLIDLYPTLLELCKLPPRPELEGQSLAGIIDGDEAKWRFATLTTYARGNHALRSTRYRYIRCEDGSEELYDHDKDPMEWTNLAGHPEYADLVKRFKAELPKVDVPYHPTVGRAPINAWFKAHYQRNP
ncbi:MAG: sulfatase [Verrucomicrobiota bacterium]